MDYEFAELEQAISKQRKILAALINYDAPDFLPQVSQERKKLDTLYRERRDILRTLARGGCEVRIIQPQQRSSR